MSIHGQTKGTALEKQIGQIATMEAMGGMMYFSLARNAQDLGYEEVAKELMGLGMQEVNHAGFYATLNGKYPKDEKQFWKLIKGVSSAEFKGETTIGKIAEALKANGLAEAAEDVSYFALQEKHHGIKTRDMYDKYAPKEEGAPEKVYVFSVCGFVYEGDLEAEPADYKCPLCGCAKGVFKLQ